MRISLFFFTLFIFAVCLIPQASHSCTTFCLDKDNQLVVGFNLDWIASDGLVTINKRRVSKTAMPMSIEENTNPARWTSKYGSVTLNHRGREFPFGGMNESGLVVQMMALFETEYPTPDTRPYINSLQWIQYQLDNFSKVEQVIASDSQLRITFAPQEPFGLHYLVSDRMGSCASIEFIGGKLTYHSNEKMPVKVLANSTYSESIKFFYDKLSGNLPVGQGNNSLFRFVRAAEMLNNYNPSSSKSVIDYGFEILSNVRAPEGFYNLKKSTHTQWSVVYDLQNYHIYFRTLENKNTRYINLKSFDFSCKTPVKVFDINANLSGNVINSFVDYTYQSNRDLFKIMLDPLPGEAVDPLSGEDLEVIARYPESTVCMDK